MVERDDDGEWLVFDMHADICNCSEHDPQCRERLVKSIDAALLAIRARARREALEEAAPLRTAARTFAACHCGCQYCKADVTSALLRLAAEPGGKNG